jgi:predicted nucleotidyltransferase component of viral defense system
VRLSHERVLADSAATGFRPEVLEKVALLLALLEGLSTHPFLNGRMALKGGTALNLFYFDIPRLSVDIDLNYVGALERETMLLERPKIEAAIAAVCLRAGWLLLRTRPAEHAGCSWALQYESALGGTGTLKVDVNFMYRLPLWAVTALDSHSLGSFSARAIPVLDIHELAAGKLAALLSRDTARDLFDAHRLLDPAGPMPMDRGRLRLAFVLYGAMNRIDWRTVAPEGAGSRRKDFSNQLAPLLRLVESDSLAARRTWSQALVDECRQRLSFVLPLENQEIEFLDRLLDHGEIKPELLTPDYEFATQLRGHPALLWKAQNVRKYHTRR